MMKKFTLLFTFVLSFSVSQAQEVSTEQWTMVSKRTADWCTFCGTWGWQLFEDLIEDNKDKNVILWSTHYSGNLKNPASEAITESLGGAGQPLFFVDRDNMGVNSSNIGSKRDEINGYIDALTAFAPLVGVGLTATYGEGVLSVDGTVEFLSAVEDGEYYLAYYLVKDHLIAPQTSQGSEADHRYVLSDVMTDAPFGDLVVQGAVSGGSTYQVQASKEIADIDIENDEVVAIIWNLRSDGVYAFFNANRAPIGLSASTSPIEIKGVTEIETRQSVEEVTISITTERPIGEISTRLVHISGQTVASQLVQATTGSHQVTFATGDLIAGTYLIQVQSGDEIYTEKLIII